MINKKEKKTSLSLVKIKFLSDQPLTIDRERDIRFGHSRIADNLKEIILQCPLSFTIGLFGKWGSGKTTIINLLKHKLKDNKIAIVNFDIWKHERDSLRRAFLTELVNQSKSGHYLSNKFELSRRLKFPIRKTIKGVLNWNRKNTWFLIGILILLSFIGYLLYKYNNFAFFQYISIIFGGGFISTVIFWIISRTFTTETETVILEPFKDPHEFEEEFNRIVKDISTKKILIIIDNLDRCTSKGAVELLSTIKTFLAKDTDIIENKCSFLIACDDEAIKKHLEGVYINSSDKDSAKECFSSDEFLRKFFNAFLRIPDFIDTELQDYTESLLKETGIPQFDSPDVAYVIEKAFRENPRQIKQFINILIVHFLLARERETGPKPLIIPEGTITKNVAFLAKYLVIRQKYSKEHNQIREEFLTIEEMVKKGSPEFKDFINSTKPITVPDIRPFIYLKQSEEELAIPGVKELELDLIDNKQEIIKKRLKDIKANSYQLQNLKKYIPELIKRNIKRRIRLLNIISCSLEAFRHHAIVMSQAFYNQIADLLNDDEILKPELHKFEPSLIFDEILKRINGKTKKGIVTQYFNVLIEQKKEEEAYVSEDYAYKLIKEMIEHRDWLDKKTRSNLKQALAEIYYSSQKILSLFKDRVGDQKEFISEELIEKFLGSFSNDDVENSQIINEKVGLLLNFNEIITPNVAENVIQTLKTLLENENQKAFREEKENFLERIEDIFNTLSSQIEEISDKTPINTFADILIQGVNAIGDWNQRKIFIFISFELVDLVEDPQKSTVNTFIQDFFNNSDADSIEFVFNKLNKDYKEELILEYNGVFNLRVMQQQPIYDLLYPLAPQDLRSKWIEDLITSHPQRALAKLEGLKYKVDDKIRVVETLLNVAQGAEIQVKEDLFKVINEMKCAKDAELRKDFATQIKSLLKNMDTNQQKVGCNTFQEATYLSETLKREIGRETIDWLVSLQPQNAGQREAAKSVLVYWDILHPPVKEDYIDFVFDKLIKNGIDMNNIRLGFELLSEIKPKIRYKKYHTYFDDVLFRIEQEENIDIKKELNNGLLRLKPQKTNDRNKNIWKKLKEIK